MGPGRGGGRPGTCPAPLDFEKIENYNMKRGKAGEKANKTENIYNITKKYVYIFIITYTKLLKQLQLFTKLCLISYIQTYQICKKKK